MYHLNVKAQLKHPVYAGRSKLTCPGKPDGLETLASVASDARTHTRAPHRPTALDHHLAVKHQRVELDMGLMPVWLHGPRGGGSFKNC